MSVPPLLDQLAGLPEARRRNLIWSAGFQQQALLDLLDGLQPAPGLRPPACSLWDHQFASYPSAHAGPDGTYHLRNEQRRWPTHYCPDRCRAEPSAPATAPELVPIRQRCPLSAAHWPGHQDPHSASAADRIRCQVAGLLGVMCSVCGGRPAQILDHDHFTGLIRGYLCKYCNSNVDMCWHPTGCAFADYLNTPPAGPLKITHPRHDTTMNNKRYRDRCARLAPYGLSPSWYTPPQEPLI